MTVAVGHYLLDKSASKFTVQAFAGGMLAALGHSPTIAIRDFSGEADFDAAAPDKASLKIQIRADSLEVTDDIKSTDRAEMESTMNQKVLETAKYPSISFEAATTSVTQLNEGRYQVKMDGKLSLHGTTGKEPIAVQVTLIGDMMRASGAFTLLQSDYGIQRVNVAGGTLKLKDELKFNFDIVARKQG